MFLATAAHIPVSTNAYPGQIDSGGDGDRKTSPIKPTVNKSAGHGVVQTEARGYSGEMVSIKFGFLHEITKREMNSL